MLYLPKETRNFHFRLLYPPGSGGTHIQSQYLGGRGRRISFEVSLVYKASKQVPGQPGYTEKPCFKNLKGREREREREKHSTQSTLRSHLSEHGPKQSSWASVKDTDWFPVAICSSPSYCQELRVLINK